MGKKKTEDNAPAVEEPEEDKEEDTPVVKTLKEIDDKYCAIEVELEKEIEKLRKQYNDKQAPLLEERRQALAKKEGADADDASKGTPACPGFWLQAFQNAGEELEVFDCDNQVLEYLSDIRLSFLDDEHPLKGVRLEFVFAENPFFSNDTLWTEAHFDYDPKTYKPYHMPDCVEIKACQIDWKAGKNITVEKIPDRGGAGAGGKKSKQKKKAKEEAVPSLFRQFFTSWKAGDDLPVELECFAEQMDMDPEEDGDEFLDSIGQTIEFIAREFIPYAIRYYTGEVGEDDDFDFEESEEEDDDDDDEEDDDDESEEEPAPKGKNKKGAKGKKDGAANGGKTEECKQQ